ncbi:MAG: hypothetical protein H7Y32_11570 [Chloroflexales bacterium]|nr:hypothetical protein [Chloroflexales bacterium]
MFSKQSRYRKLPDVITTDAAGRTLMSKSLRPLPRVTGQFEHIVAEGDRLDHLAYKYYRQSRKWWRICDANAAFLSPQALLGSDPLVQYFVPLSFDADEPPWAALLAALGALVGVEQAVLHDDERGVVVHFNRMNLSVPALAAAIEGQGFEIGTPQPIGRIGKPIVIPPDTAT